MQETSETLLMADQARIHALQNELQAAGLDAFFITNLTEIRWLTGFSGSNASVLVRKDLAWLFTDFRYQEQVKSEVKNAIPIIANDGFITELKSGKYRLDGQVGFQSDKITVSFLEKLKSDLPDVDFVPKPAFFENLMMVKTPDEIEKMQKAVEISDKVFEKILPLISPDVTELDIAAEISYWNKKFGAEKDSFDPIVASGPRGAMPHAKPSNQKLLPNQLIVIDMGCYYQGYASDQTRTVGLGKISSEAKKIYNLVLQAHLLGIESAKAGMSGKILDEIVRNFLTKTGYGSYFGHSLGHGVGLEVHEQPHVSRRSVAPMPAGSVITIEPGIYLPEQFGVRIEDMVLLSESGATPFQKSAKQLIEV
ncbi:peptidase M24 [Chloroherpeton thalassium ATCC 35110]|uniref:Peptidase M24 n=1 Tax=Chloroherpeton thalassium (strain ATCC 35110 / GB-78) TaxID=517418 RepID=B3QWK6_CHLT3|nr:aminopeptidase P family protein [Chloroherpeton thalassium]ACF14766.1 peptidase M24 [Chloroherpeton thalassium ATCC 35110]